MHVSGSDRSERHWQNQHPSPTGSRLSQLPLHVERTPDCRGVRGKAGVYDPNVVVEVALGVSIVEVPYGLPVGGSEDGCRSRWIHCLDQVLSGLSQD